MLLEVFVSEGAIDYVCDSFEASMRMVGKSTWWFDVEMIQKEKWIQRTELSDKIYVTA